jgi:hypothetical protein
MRRLTPVMTLVLICGAAWAALAQDAARRRIYIVHE